MAIISFIVLIVVAVIGGNALYRCYHISMEDVKEKTAEIILNQNEPTLRSILRSELVDLGDIDNPCYEYAKYYNETLSEKYPELDIRWERYVDICNNLTMCQSYHTFLVIGGYGSECILDQQLITCLYLDYDFENE